MKKIALFLIMMLPVLSYAQWVGAPGNIYYNTGNVGIGLSPSQKLDVMGNVAVRGSSSIPHSELQFYRYGSPLKFASIGQGDLTAANSTFDIQHFNGNDIRFLISNVELLRLVSSNGNVGIGTSTPTARLNVLSTASATTGIIDLGAAGSNTNLKFGLNVDYAWIQSYGSRPLRINSTGNDVLFNIDGGNVGIGTLNTGSFKLAVEGKIGAREINVTLANPWPDYVFEPSYAMLTIEQLDNYIKANKHLPEVPSASTVQKEGLNVGEINTLLLKKMEELTLYVIDLKKEIQNQQLEIDRLKLEKSK